MSRHWKPSGSTRWLRPEEYAALSPAEKRQLWREREVARHSAQVRPVPARYRKGYFAKQRWAWLAIVMALGFAATRIGLPALPDAVIGSSETGVRASFGSCKWGGGTNCVVDGDTFYIGGEKVRIGGIDAPETHDYRCESELALGEQAAERLRALLNSGAVTMTAIDRDRDVYGRLLRNVAVDGRDVGEALISEGLAREYAGGRWPWC